MSRDQLINSLVEAEEELGLTNAYIEDLKAELDWLKDNNAGLHS